MDVKVPFEVEDRFSRPRPVVPWWLDLLCVLPVPWLRQRCRAWRRDLQWEDEVIRKMSCAMAEDIEREILGGRS